MIRLKHILVIPCLDPDGVEVKLWFQEPPAESTRVVLRVNGHGMEGTAGQELRLALPGAPRWTPERPEMLTLHLSVGDEEHHVRFGLRRVTAHGEKLFINGEPFYVRGFGCDGDRNGGLYRQVETAAGYRNYVQRAKEFGFNTMRLHKIFQNDAPPEFLDACDELGLFMWAEFQIDPRGDWSKLTDYWNHPSVIWWCWGNELGGCELLPWANECYDFIKPLDPSRLVMDNSGWGAYDRRCTDVFSHHMGYYFPHGKHARCYSSYALFTAEAGVQGEDLSEAMDRMRRGTFRLGKPLIAHETGNHQAFPDILRRKERMAIQRRPELLKKVESGGGIRYLDRWVQVSGQFKQAMDKLWMEQARKSPILEGYEMWMLSDHAHIFAGLVEDGEECRVKPGIAPAAFRLHNAPDVLLADFPQNNSQRIFVPGERFTIQLMASIYGPEPLTAGLARWRLRKEDEVVASGDGPVVGAPRGGVYVIGDLPILVPTMTETATLRLEIELPHGGPLCNSWNIWVFPEPAPVEGNGPRVVRGLTENMLRDLEQGANVVLLLEDPSSVARTDQAFNSVLARFRPQIWEWGHNLGAAVEDHPALAGFPHEGFSDLQFFRLIDLGRKIILDGCPFVPDPIVHAVDVPMMTYSPEVYARRAAYLFELQVGQGRLLVSGFNFSGENLKHVEVRTLYNALVRYAGSDAFRPGTRVDAVSFRAYTAPFAERPAPRPSTTAGAESDCFYTDRDKNGLNKFADRDEDCPVVETPRSPDIPRRER